MIKIGFLADNLEVVPTLAQWFRVQWPDYYAQRPPREIAQDFYAEANWGDLPVRLIAFAGGELAGTVALREQALHSRPEYHPGLGGLFVPAQYRRQGIGTALVEACMNVAQAQGYEMIFTATVTAQGILARLGWQQVQQVLHDGEQLMLYSCALVMDSPDAG